MFEQTLIPGFPDDALNVGKALSILEKDGRVTYFVGGDDYFSHPSGDAAARRLALATLMENGDVRPVDLTGEPLFIPQRTLMNWTAQLRRDGAQSFFRAAPPRRPRVINETVGASGATLLAEGLRPSEVARHAGIEESTLRNAIRRKAVPELPKSPECADGSAASTAQCLGTTLIAGRMFSRWCQESCFAYMMQHYDLDGLIQYGTDAEEGQARQTARGTETQRVAATGQDARGRGEDDRLPRRDRQEFCHPETGARMMCALV